MALPKNIKKKIQQAVLELEKRQLKNNYYIIGINEEVPDIKPQSLVIRLTPYKESGLEGQSEPS